MEGRAEKVSGSKKHLFSRISLQSIPDTLSAHLIGPPQLFDQPGVVRSRAKVEGRLRSRVSGAAASRGLVTHVARPGDCAKSDTPSLGHGTQSSNPDTALRRERQPLGIDRPDLGMLQDFAKVHEMP